MITYLNYVVEKSDMNVKKYARTGSFAPASWLAVLEDGDNARISYRADRLKIVKGQTPLPNNDGANVVVDEEVETEGSGSRLDDRDMVRMLEDYNVNISLENQVQRDDQDISNIEDNMDQHLEDLKD